MKKKALLWNMVSTVDSMFVTMISEMERNGSLLPLLRLLSVMFMNTSVMWGQQICL